LPVSTTEQPDAGALGAAIIAGIGAGVWDDVEQAVEATVRVARTYEPDPATAAVYAKRYSQYVGLYDDLVETFSRSAT
jgi:xylulokinase